MSWMVYIGCNSQRCFTGKIVLYIIQLIVLRETMNPIDFADKYSIEYAIKTNTDHKKKYGQYLTPPRIAHFMSTCIRKREDSVVEILDPGIGTGILGISSCLRLAEISPTIKQINLMGYEIDPDIIPFTRRNLHYLKEWLSAKGISFTFEMINKDFILDTAHVLSESRDLFKQEKSFDIIISNPPYLK
jgi:type I restriction-modification system DNA methylase subunit